ncbi:beta-glucosidase 1 precursor [Geopyxis carbonaria]|nr:beta-glucosidase 1 precursor [Geopyxis carbonaria]
MHLLPLLPLLPLAAAAIDHTDLLSQLPAPVTPRTWPEAYALAAPFVAGLSRSEKISLTTGRGIGIGPCHGNVAGIARVNFPALCLSDGPLAVRDRANVTVFPAGLTAGATWDSDLIYLRGRALGVENRAQGVHISLGPVAGALGRAPAAGRGWEGFGADPVLAGVANAAAVRGVQEAGVVATVKHWVGNEQERYRLALGSPWVIFKALDSQVDERTLKELYEFPFDDAVRADVGAVMCSYQRVNEDYSCESSTIIKSHLKNATTGLGFKGLVMTDWFASAASSLSAAAGVDLVMPGDLGAVGNAGAGLMASTLSNATLTALDEMATRVVAAWYKMRQDARPLPAQGSPGTFDTELHAAIARRVAAEGTVLLKNTARQLPLKNTTGLRVGVYGNDAGLPAAGLNQCGEFAACDDGTLAVGWGSGAGRFQRLVTPLAAISEKVRALGGVLTANTNDFAYANVSATAAAQDVCIVAVNSRSGEATNTVDDNYGDRNNLTLWRQGDKLISTVAAACKNTVVVLHSVGAVDMEAWIEHPNVTAVLAAHLPGQESGGALVDVIWGAVNPSGKLPYTVAKKRADYCCDVQYDWSFFPEQPFPEGLLVDYRWFDAKNIEPRFPFGFGLSYTNFTYGSTLTLSAVATPTDMFDTVFTVSATVTNSGNVFGKEVVQLYLEPPATAPSGTPVRTLRGFSKIGLAAGASGSVVMKVRKRDVSTWDVATQRWTLIKGSWGVRVAASSRDLRIKGSVTI